MSHELRTPLNAIIGFSEMMRTQMFGSLGDEHYGEYANNIFVAGHHLLSLINDILDMSDINTGKTELLHERLDITKVADDALKLIEGRAFENQITIKRNIDTLPTIYADGRAVKQILLNLLSNAIKFTPEGGTVTLSGDADLNWVTISVSDTGVGIQERQLKQIEDPFVSNEPHDVTQVESIGFGLALCRSLVSLHGGDLTIESEYGVGTNVSFTLPRRAGDTVQEADIEEAPQKKRRRSARKSRLSA